MSDSRRVVPNQITVRSGDAPVRVDPIVLASMGQARAKSPALSGRDFVTVGCAIVFVAVMGLLYLLQSADVTRIAYQVNDQRAGVDRLTQLNTVLSSEVLELSRLERIEARAKDLGLERPDQTLYLSLDGASAVPTPTGGAADQ